VYLPGAGFFIIPLFIGLLMFHISIYSKKSEQKRTILFSLLVIPVLLIFVPLIQMFPVGLGLKMTAISTVLTILILGILLPVFAGYKEVKSLSNLFLLLSVLAFISAGFTSKYSKDRRKPNSILYVLDADQNKAYWASYDKKTDRFTQQFLGDDPTEGTFTDKITGSKYGTNFNLYKTAKITDIAIPQVEILKDTIIDRYRNIHLKIIPEKHVNRLELISKDDLHFKTFILNGEALKGKQEKEFIFDTLKNKHILSYFFTENDTIIDLSFSIPEKEDPDMELFEASYDLFKNAKIKTVKPNIILRDSIMMPTPFVLNDAVLVKKSINFD
ncbi:MAG: peptidase M28, partial [Flavobacteriia bacterium]